MQRVAVYIDGFNLHYGLLDKGWRRYFWLNVRRLAENLLQPHQSFVLARYFTAKMRQDSHNPGNSVRQETFLEATELLPDVHIHLGYYSRKRKTCTGCGADLWVFEEKMTDVNIASSLLCDAQDDVFDTGIIVSADSDLVSPIREVLFRFPGKRMVVAFPPKRVSKHLRQVATGHFVIGRKKFEDSQLPSRVIKPDGYILSRPPAWN